MSLRLKVDQLNKGAFKQVPAEVFASYSSVIEGWINLNRRVIDDYFSAGDPDVYTDVKLLNNVLLPLTENIGKMRGMGSGIVARGYCKKTEISAMKGFVGKIEYLKKILERHLSQSYYDSLSQKEMIAINQHIEAYAELTVYKVIGQESINLVTNEYFDQGTASISDVLKVYNAISTALSKP